jgi:hypothetical protein
MNIKYFYFYFLKIFNYRFLLETEYFLLTLIIDFGI